jgi:7-cyano-7-deazaguanine synthase
MSEQKRAVILVSGGLDSTTVLAMAQSQGYACYTLSFDYGQRHRAELYAADKVSRAFGDVEHKLVKLNLDSIGGSALTDMSRNTVFLSIALGWAEVLGAHDIFIGVNAVDYSGYPDCRPEYIAAFETMANLATRAGVEGQKIAIHTPLMALGKGDIILAGIALGVDYATTVSCYQATEEGLACGKCDSCRLRRQGFADAGLEDPTHYLHTR